MIQKQHYLTRYQLAIKVFFGLAALWLVSVDPAVASCVPNQSPTSDCDGLLLDQSDIDISIPATITVGPDLATDWAVDIDANTDNIGFTNNGSISGGTRGISVRNTATNITITNANSIFTPSGVGISNQGAISGLLNSGDIFSIPYAIENEGVISSLNNSGNIFSSQFGVFNTPGAYIGSISNTGLIDSGLTLNMGDALVSGVYNFQSEIGAITNGVGSRILSNGASGFTLINYGIANANDVGGMTSGNSSIGNIINRGSVEATGGAIAAGIFNGYLPKFSGGSPTTASATNSIQSITNYGRLYAEGDGLISAGVVNGGYAPLINSGDRDESYNPIHRIENFSRIEGSSISSLGGFGAGIFNGTANYVGGGISNRDGYVIDELINNSDGIITGSSTDTSTAGVGILNAGVITEIQNAGVIDGSSSGGSAIGIFNFGVIESLNNQATGNIENGIFNVAIGGGGDAANINNVINSGVIRNTGSNFDPDAMPNPGTIASFAIHNYGGAIINNLTNTETGQIINGIGNSTDSTMNYLTNLGEIQAGIGGYGIINAGSIGDLNNLQGGSQPLTYSGPLPTNYNIIIYSTSNYGKIEVTSPGFSQTRFGIYGGSLLSNGTYSSVLAGVTRGNLAAVTGTYGSATWSLINSSGTIWDLLISGIVAGPSAADTQMSLQNTASVLQNIYTLQNSVLVNSFSYDCNVFGANNVCVSAGGRNTAVSAANGLNNTSALLIAAYRPHPNYRIGAYADQNLSVNNAGSTVNLGNNTPLIGIFGAWNERLDGTGTEVKVSAAYGQKNATVTRQVVGLSEAGSGSSNLNSQGAQVTAKYGFGVTPDVIVSPYVGMRYTQNNMGGYTESASSTVTAPLTYSALNTNAITALAGVGASYRFIPQATAFASAGIESDTNTNNGAYSATGITGLTAVNFNPNPVKTRATATLGAYYDIEKNQRVGITGIYRQEPYQSVETTTVMATYTIGL